MDSIQDAPKFEDTYSDDSKLNSEDIELDDSATVSLDEEEIAHILTTLRIGIVMSHYHQGTCENKFFRLQVEEFRIQWFQATNKDEPEGSILIEEIKEVQRGPTSADFHPIIHLNNPDRCIVLIYGTGFTLKVLSCLASSPHERDSWMKSLIFLRRRNRYAPPRVLIQRWLCRKWTEVTKKLANRITFGGYQQFLQYSNCKLTSRESRIIFNVVSKDMSTIDAVSFCKAYFVLLDLLLLVERYKRFFEKDENDILFMCPSHFQKFLLTEQGDLKAKDIQYVHDVMKYAKPDVVREEEEVTSSSTIEIRFEMHEFLFYLFSAMNSIFKNGHRVVYQDMSKPLSWYWIASSHNTYLTGDQIQSCPSEEAYVRVLRMGCRCITVTCWDGPDNEPQVHHGLMASTKIRFRDIVKVIANNAFLVSEYPLILYIECHCSISQQIIMADIIKKILGKYLVTDFLDPNETDMPSPEALKRRIIVKLKTLQCDIASAGSTDKVEKISKCIYSGIIHVHNDNGDWERYYVALRGNLLYLSRCPGDTDDTAGIESKEDRLMLETEDENDSHLTSSWYHKNISRVAGENLMIDQQQGDGTFMVRPSNKFVGDYTLSVWWKNRIRHLRIQNKTLSDGSRKFFFTRKYFDSLSALVEFYQDNPLKADTFEFTLKEAVPEPEPPLSKDWFVEKCTRQHAESMLREMKKDGGYLVWKPGNEGKIAYTVSFCTGRDVKHCDIYKEDRMFMLGSRGFDSMTHLIGHFQDAPLYRTTKLKYPCNYVTIMMTLQEEKEKERQDCYVLPNVRNEILSEQTKVTCLAKYDYTAQNDGELSFKKGTFIVNITKSASEISNDGEWWKGDANGKVQKWFPVKFTDEILVLQTSVENIYKGEYVTFDGIRNNVDVSACLLKLLPVSKDRLFSFRLHTRRHGIIDFRCNSEKEMAEWLTCIKEASRNNGSKKKIENEEFIKSKTKVAKELLRLVAFYEGEPFTEKTLQDGGRYDETISLCENKMALLTGHQSYNRGLIKFCEHQCAYVHPKTDRIDASNYDPVPFWNFGVQMCALNYQTTDCAMQIERGFFFDNGACGYILQPEIFRDPKYDPFNPKTFGNIRALDVRITIVGARHLIGNRREIVSPFVEIRVIGLECDNSPIHRTSTVRENGLCPVWHDATFDFRVYFPRLVKIHFIVKDEDVFGDTKFLLQASFPLMSMREGHRSVSLRNATSEEMPLAALLIELRIQEAPSC